MDTTAPSLLLALLGVKNRGALQAVAKQAAGGKTPAEQLAAAVTPEEQAAAQAAYAAKYFYLGPKQKEVQEKLYKTLYAITEYPYLPQNRNLSMAMGKVLAASLLEGIVLQPKDTQQITELGETLRRGVTDAIDEAAK